MKGEFQIALATYHEAERIRCLLDDDHLNVAATIYNAGQIHHQRGELEKVMKCYMEFWRITLPILERNIKTLCCSAEIYGSSFP